MGRVRVVCFIQIGSSRIPVSAFRVIPTKASQRVIELSHQVLQDRLTRGLTRLCGELAGREGSDGRSFE